MLPRAIAVLLCTAAAPGCLMQITLQAEFLFYPSGQAASLSNSLQERILMAEIREKLKAQGVCFKHLMFPLLGYFGLWLSSFLCYTKIIFSFVCQD